MAVMANSVENRPNSASGGEDCGGEGGSDEILGNQMITT